MLTKISDFVAENGLLFTCLLLVAALVGLQGHFFTFVMLALLALLHHRKGYLDQFMDRYGLANAKETGPTLVMLAVCFATYIAANNMDERERIALAAEIAKEESQKLEVAENDLPESTSYWATESAPDLEAVSNCVAIDGDTLNCAGERIRLLGIDAPELPGHCQVGRVCVPGDPFASKRSLEGLIEPTMDIIRYGRDRYGRTLAMVYVWEGSLSCRQLRTGNAMYVSEWDENGVVAADCPVKAG